MDNLAARILRHAVDTPHKVATHSGAVSLTYGQLEEQASKAAHVLSKRGVSQGRVVGIALRNGQQTIVAMLGVWLAGGICSLIDFRYSGPEKKSLADSHNHVLILEDRHRPTDGYPGLSLADWTEELAAASVAPASPAPNDSPAYLAFTSGTTGSPASLEISHRAMLRRAASTAAAIGPLYERYLSTAPLSFGGSQAWVINALLSGGTVFFFPTIFRPQEILEAFGKHRITGCTLVPTVLRDLLEYVRATGITPVTSDAPLWLATHAAAIQPSELISIRAMLSPHVIQVYACLPVGPVTLLDLDKDVTKVDTVGRPLPGIELKIVDEHDKPLPPMTVGRIKIKSPGRATSLKGRGKDAGTDFFRGDSYYPGDLGLIDTDGCLKLMGRSTDVIIRGGVNVYPQEVEAAATDLPGIRRVAAVGYPDERAGEEIAVFVVVDPGVSADEVQRYFKSRLPPNKRPKRILVVPQLPVNASGKIAKDELIRLLMHS